MKKRAEPTIGHAATNYTSKRAKIDQERQLLPAWSARARLIDLMRGHATVVVVGETGSGKTTQLPRFLFEAGLVQGGAIACTQPRRVAAVSVAKRVADEMGVKLGTTVGYQVRFDDCSTPATRIKYMTDGMLLREALLSPTLERYKVVVVDEAHERTVSTDVLLGLLKQIQASRKGTLKLLIMSATLDVEKFLNYFPDAAAGRIQGRQYPVQIYYTPTPEASYMEAALVAAVQVHTQEMGSSGDHNGGGNNNHNGNHNGGGNGKTAIPGDILVFLTGQDEIEAMERLLTDRLTMLAKEHAHAHTNHDTSNTAPPLLDFRVVPIYAALPQHKQMAVFEPTPAGTRKIILATNIAETSITIPGVQYVIDTGVVKARNYAPRLGADSLQVVPISQAQACQRSGRAGREAPGKAYRLYTEATYTTLEHVTPPEIQRVNLGGVVLQLLSLGVTNVLGFDFVDPPPMMSLLRAMELLCALGAVGSDGRLTALGKQMGRLPVEPMFARALLCAVESGCAKQVLAITAMVSTDAPFFLRNRTNAASHEDQEDTAPPTRSHPAKRLMNPLGDHITMLDMYEEFATLKHHERVSWCREHALSIRALTRAHDIHTQLTKQMQRAGFALLSHDATSGGGGGGGGDAARSGVLRALVAGLFPHAAQRTMEGNYKVIATGQTVHIHPSSVLCGKAPACIIFSEAVHTTKHYARQVSAVDASWLIECAPSFFAQHRGRAG